MTDGPDPIPYATPDLNGKRPTDRDGIVNFLAALQTIFGGVLLMAVTCALASDRSWRNVEWQLLPLLLQIPAYFGLSLVVFLGSTRGCIRHRRVCYRTYAAGISIVCLVVASDIIWNAPDHGTDRLDLVVITAVYLFSSLVANPVVSVFAFRRVSGRPIFNDLYLLQHERGFEVVTRDAVTATTAGVKIERAV